MSEKDPAEIFGDALCDGLAAVVDTDRYKKAKQAFLDSMWDDLQYSIIDNMPEALEMLVRDMADRAVNAMLQGQPDEVRRYLKLDGWTGRDRDHPVIHGTLLVPQTMELRAKVAKANEALLRDERILDLEDQVAALVKSVASKDLEIERLRDRVSGSAF
ncbi:hypothetical protein RM190_04785 [Paracoccus sp. CPCC 101403]|uniref:Uncharacterized protein n=1 Tax=Paracoccus broussonetiae TaxID=3075834 RepID=A0ABU3EAB7_9RHOB|nr:hypothetical protein [Paracoccus sp. CPCC 101403]MDT1061164.1 hypothetical protein [Paracoccus sp. CPCC 101403]